MFKTLIAAAVTLLISLPLLAAGPSQQWRLDITGSEGGIVEVAEIELRSTAGGENVTDLIRTYTFEETSAGGLSTWAFSHNLGVQRLRTEADIVAFAVDVVAPGDWFFNPDTDILNQRTHLQYIEVEFEVSETAPVDPELGDVYYDPTPGDFYEYDGSWTPITVTSQTTPLPQPDIIEADTVTFTPAPAFPVAGGGPAATNDAEITFPQNVVGAVTITGISFDTPANNRPGVAVPVIELLDNRAAAAAFDNNKGSWFKSRRGPTFRSPLTLQYTYWVGDPDSYPTVVEYAITAKNADSAPQSWTFMHYKDGQWVQLDQQAGIRFEDGQTRVFSVE